MATNRFAVKVSESHLVMNGNMMKSSEEEGLLMMNLYHCWLSLKHSLRPPTPSQSIIHSIIFHTQRVGHSQRLSLSTLQFVQIINKSLPMKFYQYVICSISFYLLFLKVALSILLVLNLNWFLIIDEEET